MEIDRLKVLCICLGNICRSPLAEGVLKRALIDLGLDKMIQVESAGTGAWHVGKPPDSRSIRVASRHGIDLSAKRARHFLPDDLDRFDWVLCMDEQNLKDVVKHQKKIKRRFVYFCKVKLPKEMLTTPIMMRLRLLRWFMSNLPKVQNIGWINGKPTSSKMT